MAVSIQNRASSAFCNCQIFAPGPITQSVPHRLESDTMIESRVYQVYILH